MQSALITATAAEWLSVVELSQYAHMSVQTIYNLVNTGRLKPYKPAKKLLFSKKEIDSWIINTGKSPS
jgi:excisionase family DNA binding protein